MVSRAVSAWPLSRPWNLAIIAMAGFPGISRGRKKFSVTAAHSVTTKNPARRSTNLIGPLPLRCHVQQHLAHVGVGVDGRQRVRVALGRPAGEVRGVVLE